MTVFVIIWGIWFLSEVVLNRLLRSKEEDTPNLDKGSLQIIWITIGLANTLGIVSAIFIRLPFSHSAWIPYTGLFLIAGGILLRFISIISLGRFFTVDVTIRKDHRMKKDGMYRIVRHPSYAGSLLSFLGFGLSLNNLLSLVVIFVPVLFAMLHRIRIEEKFLTEQFGADYTSYMNNTYRLIPWVY